MLNPVFLLATIIVCFFPSFSQAGITDNYTISFETTDCEGSSGLGVLALTDLVRINPYRCANGTKLHQVLARPTLGIAGGYEVYTITSKELAVVKKEIAAWRKAQRDLLTKGSVILTE